MGSPTKGFRFVEGTQMLARRSPKYLFFHSEPFAYCHSEPFACHSERSEGSGFLAQDKLREVSHQFLRHAQDKLRLTPQNDIWGSLTHPF